MREVVRRKEGKKEGREKYSVLFSRKGIDKTNTPPHTIPSYPILSYLILSHPTEYQPIQTKPNQIQSNHTKHKTLYSTPIQSTPLHYTQQHVRTYLKKNRLNLDRWCSRSLRLLESTGSPVLRAVSNRPPGAPRRI